MKHLFVRRVRNAALTLAAFALGSCTSTDGGDLSGNFGTGPTNVAAPPAVKLTVAGAHLDTVDVNSPLTFNVKASHQISLKAVSATVYLDTTLITSNLDTFTTATPSYDKTLSLSLAGIPAASRITLRARALDGSNQVGEDSIRLVTIDTVKPVVTVNAPAANTVYNRGDTIQVDLSAADSSGLARVAYDMYRLVTPVDTAAFRTDSTNITVRVTKLNASFKFVVPTGTIAGTYLIRGRALDRSGSVSVSSFRSIIIRDATKPVPSFNVAGMFNADTTITAGDTNLVVTARITDNVGLARVKFWAFSTRGSATLGRVDTLMRYDTVYAPVNVGSTPGTFRANLADTTVSRRMNRVTNVPAIALDTLYVAARVTDESGNDSTIVRRVFMVTTPYTQDRAKPGMSAVVPADGANITLGSNITVQARLTDNFALKRFSVVGITTSGDPSLGKVDTLIKYDSVVAPLNVGGQPQSFRFGLTDTTITRVMVPKTPTDSASDTLRLIIKVTDYSGKDSTIIRKVNLLAGPTVKMTLPINGATTFPGGRVPIHIDVSGPARLVEIGYSIQSATFNPAPVKRDVTAAAATSGTLDDTLVVPANFPAGSTLRVVPFARDAVNPNLTTFGDSATVIAQVPSVDRAGPLVFQSIPGRPESGEQLSVRASDPSGVRRIGFKLVDAQSGAIVAQADSTFGAIAKDTVLRATITIPLSSLGHTYKLYSFAFDTLGNRGNNLVPGITLPDSIRADTTRGTFAFGTTYRTTALDASNLAGDVAVDRSGNVYLSNINRNRLERWDNTTKTYSSPVLVGSQPWGMTFSRTADTLFVANSGGTNISVLPLASMIESRIKTPNNVIYGVTRTGNSSGVTNFSGYFEADFSDRPQYIAMSANGSLYYSTRPTTNAGAGTIRRLDRRPPLAQVEVEQITTYISGADKANDYLIVNADSILIKKAATAGFDDSLIVYDHVYGNYNTVVTARGVDPAVITASLRTAGSDVIMFNNADFTSLGLTDTTFVAAGGDGKVIAFGEAHVAGDKPGRVMLVNDTLTTVTVPPPNITTYPFPPFDIHGSASVSVTDLTNNASDKIFGLAVDSLSGTVVANGAQTFFADVSRSALFNLRLQGSYKTTQAGAGVAYHPKYAFPTTDTLTRVAFASQGDTSIAVIDAYNFILRKVIPVRTTLYGPIRAVLPTTAEAAADPNLSVKLYCLTKEGLLVIFLRKADLQ